MRSCKKVSLEDFKKHQLTKKQQLQVKGGNGEAPPPVVITEEVIID